MLLKWKSSSPKRIVARGESRTSDDEVHDEVELLGRLEGVLEGDDERVVDALHDDPLVLRRDPLVTPLYSFLPDDFHGVETAIEAQLDEHHFPTCSSADNLSRRQKVYLA